MDDGVLLYIVQIIVDVVSGVNTSRSSSFKSSVDIALKDYSKPNCTYFAPYCCCEMVTRQSATFSQCSFLSPRLSSNSSDRLFSLAVAVELGGKNVTFCGRLCI